MSTRTESGMFRSFHVRNYRIWFIGALVSNTGAWMQATALSWVVLTQLIGDRGQSLDALRQATGQVDRA